MKFKLPIKTVSEANKTGEHWTKKHKRHKSQKNTIRLFLSSHLSEKCLPCQINLTRIAPRSLDDDNLSSAMKNVRDYICDLLIPGKRMGRADSDKRIEIKYEQMRGVPKEYAIEVEILSI